MAMTLKYIQLIGKENLLLLKDILTLKNKIYKYITSVLKMYILIS